jgi:hypothetical protein
VIFGGYGTFGAHVARELANAGITVRIAGRDAVKAEGLARQLGLGHQSCVADVNEPVSARTALLGQTVAVNCAGPFSSSSCALLDQCLAAACHYVDIADERRYVALVRGYGDRLRQRRLAAVYGCSSLPAISGALALAARIGTVSTPRHARVTLFIGHNNPKGRAAIASLVRVLGTPIRVPQGVVTGFRDREIVRLPAPFGRRAVFNFDSPEYDLFPQLLGVSSVSVKVGFEMRLATYALALLAALSSNYSERSANFLAALGNRFRYLGRSGGVVLTELFFPDASVRRAAMFARRDGQRMAALPCAQVVQTLCAGTGKARGAMTAYDFLGGQALLHNLTAAGFDLLHSEFIKV